MLLFLISALKVTDDSLFFFKGKYKNLFKKVMTNYRHRLNNAFTVCVCGMRCIEYLIVVDVVLDESIVSCFIGEETKIWFDFEQPVLLSLFKLVIVEFDAVEVNCIGFIINFGLHLEHVIPFKKNNLIRLSRV
jgi:hypothetical protein